LSGVNCEDGTDLIVATIDREIADSVDKRTFPNMRRLPFRFSLDVCGSRGFRIISV